MKKKTQKKTNKTSIEKELGHYFGSLQESSNENLKAIREGFNNINNKLDSHSRILDAHSKVLFSHDQMLKQIVKDVGTIKAELKKKVDYDEFAALEKRVVLLEARR